MGAPCSGDDRPRNAMMKQIEATRYSSAETGNFSSPASRLFLALERLQHALGDDEPAEDVDRGEGARQHQAEDLQKLTPTPWRHAPPGPNRQ